MDYSPFPLVELSGSARERGRQHGQAVPDRIKRGIAMYSEALLKNGVDWKELEQRANAMVPIVETFDPAYLEEMRGLAEGSGQAFAGIMLMNARTEMVAAARKQHVQSDVPDGCTAALALPEASADGTLLHGQNWDWRAECAETGVVLRIRRDDGPDILTFTEAGGPYDKKVAERLRKNIFSVGNTIDPADGYRNFRGRDPKVEALMKKRGFSS